MDWFLVELEAGTRYQIDLEGADTGRGTLVDPAIEFLRDAIGDTISDSGGSDSGVGKNDRTIYTPSMSDTYYVDVSSATTATGTYTLSVIVLGANGASEADTDFPNTTATTGRVEIGASATGNIAHGGDTDWFRVDLTAGRQYQFDMEGMDTGRGTYTDPFMQLFDAPGTFYLAEDSDGGEGKNARLTYTPATSGLHFLMASRGLAALSGTGTYTLSVRDITLPPDDPPDDSGDPSEADFREGDTDLPASTDTTGVVEVDGFGARGAIHEPKAETVTWTGIDDEGREVVHESIVYDFDTDWFAVVLEAGKTYRIDMKGRILSGPGEPIDPELTLSLPQINAIYDADGDDLLNTWGADESSAHHLFRVTFHARAGGTYYIAASGESHEWGGYELTVTEITEEDAD